MAGVTDPDRWFDEIGGDAAQAGTPGTGRPVRRRDVVKVTAGALVAGARVTRCENWAGLAAALTPYGIASTQDAPLDDSASSRAHQRLHLLADQLGFRGDPASAYQGEQPAMLSRAFDLAAGQGLTMQLLADELAWPTGRVRTLLGITDQRPVLTLVQ